MGRQVEEGLSNRLDELSEFFNQGVDEVWAATAMTLSGLAVGALWPFAPYYMHGQMFDGTPITVAGTQEGHIATDWTGDVKYRALGDKEAKYFWRNGSKDASGKRSLLHQIARFPFAHYQNSKWGKVKLYGFGALGFTLGFDLLPDRALDLMANLYESSPTLGVAATALWGTCVALTSWYAHAERLENSDRVRAQAKADGVE